MEIRKIRKSWEIKKVGEALCSIKDIWLFQAADEIGFATLLRRFREYNRYVQPTKRQLEIHRKKNHLFFTDDAGNVMLDEKGQPYLKKRIRRPKV